MQRSPFAEGEINGVPRLEALLGAVRFISNPLPVIDGALERFGTTYYTRTIGSQRIIMTVDPDVAQHVLQKNNRNYHKSRLQVDSLGKYIGIGLLTANGDYWLQQRRLIQPGFYKKKLEGLIQVMHDEIVSYGDDLESRIAGGQKDFTAAAEMMELTLRVVSKSLFSTGISNETISVLGKEFTELQEFIVREVRQPIFNWYRNITGKSKKAMELAESVKDILRDIIQQRRESGEDHDDLLGMLLNSKYQDTGEGMTDQQILNEALILFTAGHETSANALAWTMHELSNHKDEKEALAKEYDHVCQQNMSMGALMQAARSSNVLSEVMRLYPPAWILDRVALEDDEVKGFKINKGDMIGIYLYGIQRHPDLWDNANVFEPARFDKERIETVHKYAYIPFGGGPRLCIGHHFAMIEMQMALGHMAKRFDWKCLSSAPDNAEPMITLRPKDGLPMKITAKAI